MSDSLLVLEERRSQIALEIAEFRRFQQLSADLIDINERICRLGRAEAPETEESHQTRKQDVPRDPQRSRCRGRTPAAGDRQIPAQARLVRPRGAAESGRQRAAQLEVPPSRQADCDAVHRDGRNRDPGHGRRSGQQGADARGQAGMHLHADLPQRRGLSLAARELDDLQGRDRAGRGLWPEDLPRGLAAGPASQEQLGRAQQRGGQEL